MGAENFVAEVIWEKADSPNNSASYLSKDTDTILVYAYDKRVWRRNKLPRSAAVDAIYTNPDNDPRGRWYPGDPYANKSYRLGQYEITGPTGRTFRPPKGRFWRISEENFHKLVADGRIYWGPDMSARPSIKRYLSEVEGLTPRTLWRHTEVGSNRTSKNEIRALFPGEASFSTPKPERLLQRILQVATDPGDTVLDCYAGSGTTAAVAHKMGRRWVTSELVDATVEEFTKPRLRVVAEGDDPGGITSVKERVAAEGTTLPDNVSAEEARAFNTTLSRVIDDGDVEVTVDTAKQLASLARATGKAGDGPLEDEETKTLLRLLEKFGDAGQIDITKQAKSQVARATKTRDQVTRLWRGGGGFTHLQVGPSMFTEVGGMVLLADWATQSALTEAMCAQLSIRYEPEGVFAGRSGRVRIAVVDGMVGSGTIDAIVDQLLDGENVEIWATQLSDEAKAHLQQVRPRSRLHRIPAAVLDSYRRKKAARSPFVSKSTEEDGETDG